MYVCDKHKVLDESLYHTLGGACIEILKETKGNKHLCLVKHLALLIKDLQPVYSQPSAGLLSAAFAVEAKAVLGQEDSSMREHRCTSRREHRAPPGGSTGATPGGSTGATSGASTGGPPALRTGMGSDGGGGGGDGGGGGGGGGGGLPSPATGGGG
uniref:Uncharacterized protein n=1 Tax=Amphimedon queenslandica TaxID=400682 RepID=A0A1X7UN11_AMPQE